GTSSGRVGTATSTRTTPTRWPSSSPGSPTPSQRCVWPKRRASSSTNTTTSRSSATNTTPQFPLPSPYEDRSALRRGRRSSTFHPERPVLGGNDLGRVRERHHRRGGHASVAHPGGSRALPRRHPRLRGVAWTRVL